MGLFGVPLSGSPICGTTNSSSKVDNLPTLDDEQLCNRWYQLGLLLPYAHSTSHLGHRLRSPVDWSLSSRRYMASYIQQRYRLLPYYYTLFHQVFFTVTYFTIRLMVMIFSCIGYDGRDSGGPSNVLQLPAGQQHLRT